MSRRAPNEEAMPLISSSFDDKHDKMQIIIPISNLKCKGVNLNSLHFLKQMPIIFEILLVPVKKLEGNLWLKLHQTQI